MRPWTDGRSSATKRGGNMHKVQLHRITGNVDMIIISYHVHEMYLTGHRVLAILLMYWFNCSIFKTMYVSIPMSIHSVLSTNSIVAAPVKVELMIGLTNQKMRWYSNSTFDFRTLATVTWWLEGPARGHTPQGEDPHLGDPQFLCQPPRLVLCFVAWLWQKLPVYRLKALKIYPISGKMRSKSVWQSWKGYLTVPMKVQPGKASMYN